MHKCLAEGEESGRESDVDKRKRETTQQIKICKQRPSHRGMKTDGQGGDPQLCASEGGKGRGAPVL